MVISNTKYIQIDSSLSIIIPVYNEANTLQQILEEVLKVELIYGFKKEIIIVNDCSTDHSHEIITRFLNKYTNKSIFYFLHQKNMGKGAAIQTGLKAASGDFIIIQDGDIENNPEDYNRLLEPVVKQGADVVYGSRFLGEEVYIKPFLLHSLGNRFLTKVSNIFTNFNLTDMETCYKLFRKEVIKGINLEENRFGFEPEVTAKLSKIPGLRIFEVGISYYGRTWSEGKKIGFKDVFRALYCIIKYNLLT